MSSSLQPTQNSFVEPRSRSIAKAEIRQRMHVRSIECQRIHRAIGDAPTQTYTHHGATHETPAATTSVDSRQFFDELQSRIAPQPPPHFGHQAVQFQELSTMNIQQTQQQEAQERQFVNLPYQPNNTELTQRATRAGEMTMATQIPTQLSNQMRQLLEWTREENAHQSRYRTTIVNEVQQIRTLFQRVVDRDERPHAGVNDTAELTGEDGSAAAGRHRPLEIPIGPEEAEWLEEIERAQKEDAVQPNNAATVLAEAPGPEMDDTIEILNKSSPALTKGELVELRDQQPGDVPPVVERRTSETAEEEDRREYARQVNHVTKRGRMA